MAAVSMPARAGVAVWRGEDVLATGVTGREPETGKGKVSRAAMFFFHAG